MIRFILIGVITLSASGCMEINRTLSSVDHYIQTSDFSERADVEPAQVQQIAPIIYEDASPQLPLAPVKYDPLKQMVRLEFPASARTVEQGVQHLLEGSNFELVTSCAGCPPEAPIIAADPISPLAFARPGEITTIERGALMVLGTDAGLVVDRPNQLVTFEYFTNRRPL